MSKWPTRSNIAQRAAEAVTGVLRGQFEEKKSVLETNPPATEEDQQRQHAQLQLVDRQVYRRITARGYRSVERLKAARARNHAPRLLPRLTELETAAILPAGKAFNLSQKMRAP